MPGQKPKADEHNRAKETVQMDDRHLTWKEEGMPDSLEWCVIFFFFSHLWKVLGRDPREKKGSKTPLTGLGAGHCHSS